MGKLLEREVVLLLVMALLMIDLDSLAGAVAYRHCLPLPSEIPAAASAAHAFHEASARAGLYLATASADRLDMLGRLTRDNVRSVACVLHSLPLKIRDLKFSGFVTWTGKSSMEVVVKMEGREPIDAHQDWQTLMLGRFSMVCRDSKTHSARRIPPLICDTEEERILWQIGEGEPLPR